MGWIGLDCGISLSLNGFQHNNQQQQPMTIYIYNYIYQSIHFAIRASNLLIYGETSGTGRHLTYTLQADVCRNHSQRGRTTTLLYYIWQKLQTRTETANGWIEYNYYYSSRGSFLESYPMFGTWNGVLPILARTERKCQRATLGNKTGDDDCQFRHFDTY